MAKILLIEDETSLLEVYSEILASEGHTILKASDGDTGLKLALGEAWDIMFLDLMLPNMDGIALLTKMSSENKLNGRHVIIMSNLDNPKIINECLKLGASENLNKADITPENIVSTVSKYVVETK